MTVERYPRSARRYHAAVYLATSAASYVTGAVLDVGGGIRHSNFDMAIPDLE